VPVPTLASRRLDVALQHIHKGFVTFPVIRASHLPPAACHYDHATLRIDYEGVQVSQSVRQAVNESASQSVRLLCGVVWSKGRVHHTLSDLSFLRSLLLSPTQFVLDGLQGVNDVNEGGTDVSLPFSVR
jgi:hypothetical protein